MFAIAENNNRRLAISFTSAMVLHLAVLWSLHTSAQIERGKAKIISNVELMTNQPAQTVVAPPEPKNMWEKIQQALPISKPGAAGPKESPLDTMRKIAANTTVSEPKLIDKEGPLPGSSKLPDLKQQRDAKLGELMEMSKGDQHRMQQLLVQEQALALTDRKAPIARPVDTGNRIALEEVGFKRSEKINDIAAQQEKQKAPVLQDMRGSSITERKEELRRKLASLNAEPGIKLSEGELKKLPQVTNVIGSLSERKKAQEILALQNAIKDKDPGGMPTGGGGNGWAKGTLRPVQQMGRQDVIQLNETKEQLPVAKAPAANAIDKMKQMGSVTKLMEVKKSPVELSGPIEKRKIVAAYFPRYPEWAARQGIEADVMIRFNVNAAGKVIADDIVLVKTSGYRELDQISIEALKQWVFAPLESNVAQQEQWGIITIRFKLE